MKAKIENGKLILELDIKPQVSKSGKTILVAGSAGFQQTTALHDGKQISVSVNATIPR
jgi:hypothetical protein